MKLQVIIKPYSDGGRLMPSRPSSELPAEEATLKGGNFREFMIIDAYTYMYFSSYSLCNIILWLI